MDSSPRVSSRGTAMRGQRLALRKTRITALKSRAPKTYDTNTDKRYWTTDCTRLTIISIAALITTYIHHDTITRLLHLAYAYFTR